MHRIKTGSIPIFDKQPLRIEINQSWKNPYLLERSPRRIYRIYFLVRRVPTVGTPASFSASFSLIFFSFSFFFFLSFYSLFFFLLLSFFLLPFTTNWSPPPFIDLPTCMHGDTWLAMCHPTLIPSKNMKFRLSRNSTKFVWVTRFRVTNQVVRSGSTFEI